MRIEHAADGTVRVPGSQTLAGSSLMLDQAVRNVVAWNLATPEQAVGLAATNPAALLAPALASHGIGPANGLLEWDAALRPRVVTPPG